MEKYLELFGSLPNFTFMDEQLFLHRHSNSFDTSIPLIVSNIKDKKSTYIKIVNIFGDTKIDDFGDYLVVYGNTLTKKTRYTFGDLIEIIALLRQDDGCVWDKAQTPSTIRKNIIEEAYELVEAIELGDMQKICEECGDVILQGAFTAVMSQENGDFDINDVITMLCNKLITRHTHIFGADKADDYDKALYFWEKAKAKEKNQKDIMSQISAIPVTFGALMRANKVQKYIKKTGFDHSNLQQAVEKIYEEITEFLQANKANKESEAGDILFSVVNMLRMSDIDPEVALNGTTNRFLNRFSYIIDQAKKADLAVDSLTLEQMEHWYKEAKTKEK